MGDPQLFECRRGVANKTVEPKGLKLKGTLRSEGEKILERKLQISKDEQQYFSNAKVYSNAGKVSGASPQTRKDQLSAFQTSGAEVLRYQ